MFALTRVQLVFFFFYSHENEKLIESEMWRKDDFMYVSSADCVFYLHRSSNRRKTRRRRYANGSRSGPLA